MNPDCNASPESLIIAHRGESHEAPENTLAAVNLAWEWGATAVEVDVHATMDGDIVVIHDSNTLRTTGVRLHVNKSTLSELQQLDAGTWKGVVWKGEKIPSLTDVIATVPADGRLVIEIKSGAGIPEKLHRSVTENGLHRDQVEIISFDFRKLSMAKRLMPQHRMLWAIESDHPGRQYATNRHPKAVLSRLEKYGVDGITIGDSRHLTRTYIEHFTAAEKLVYVWTVNDPARAAELLHFGVTGITTDRAAWMKEVLRNMLQKNPEPKKPII